MNDEEIQFLDSIAKRIEEGTGRTDVVQALVDTGVSPQEAQAWYDVANRYAAGQGYRGYNAWFWSIMMSKAVHAKGAGWLWLTAVLALLIFLPVCVYWVSALPSGKYPAVVLALPGLLLGMVAAYLAGMVVYKYTARRAA